jgi:hypothetical protein
MISSLGQPSVLACCRAVTAKHSFDFGPRTGGERDSIAGDLELD